MAKILLVEDDNNLREIYEARLQAEGYTIVSAMDGEAALVVAKKEKPDLVISDVMMPRISGFEMLDILRNTEGLRDVKVIMLTALGQAEDKTRADSLGADRYLVKSQVTLEDIVKAAHELLGSDATDAGAPQATAAAAEQAAAMAAAASAAPAPAAPATAPAQPQAATPAAPVSPAPPIPVATPPVATPTMPSASTQPASSPAAPASAAPAITPTPPATTTPTPPSDQPPAGVPTPVTPPQPPSSTPPAPEPTIPPTPQAPVTPPASDTPEPTPAPASANDTNPSQIQTASEEEAAVKAQIESFVNQNSQTAPKPASASTTPAAPATPAGDSVMADAIKNLVSDTGSPAAPATNAAPKVINPPTHQTSDAPAPASATPADDDSVTVAHKKIISPISHPEAPQEVGLDELLAKEGLTTLDDETHDGSQPVATNPALPSQPAMPSNLPGTPHPPGHVISPNSGNGVDPNSIAL